MIRRLATAALLAAAALTPIPAHASTPPPEPDSSIGLELAGPWYVPTDDELLALADEDANSAPVVDSPEPNDPVTEPAPPDEPAPDELPVEEPSGCELPSPWEQRSFQADDDCDGTANVCEDVPADAFTEAVRRGYGSTGDYCIPTSAGVLLPPFPDCVAGGWDDYDCDGRPDVWTDRG